VYHKVTKRTLPFVDENLRNLVFALKKRCPDAYKEFAVDVTPLDWEAYVEDYVGGILKESLSKQKRRDAMKKE
jgi:hypothetical protein